MSDSLVPVNFENLPSTQIGSDADFDAIAKSSDFLPRLQLYTKGKAINKRLVLPGNYGIPISEDEVTDLGDAIDVVILARRPKAVDLKDLKNIVTIYDVNDPGWKRIVAQSAEKESGCMYGTSFLVYERSTAQFLEFFCGTKSSRIESKRLFAYLPCTQADIDRAMDAGKDTTGMTVHGPLPVTLKSRLVESKFSWHVPVAIKCSTPFTTFPPVEVVLTQIQKFLMVKCEGAAVVPEDGVAVSSRVR